MVQINWTIEAVSDLKEIAMYISKDSQYYAKLQIERLRNKTAVLKSYVFFGRVVPEIDRKDIRELISGNYRIIYKVVNEKRVDILTIHHSARDLSRRIIT